MRTLWGHGDHVWSIDMNRSASVLYKYMYTNIKRNINTVLYKYNTNIKRNTVRNIGRNTNHGAHLWSINMNRSASVSKSFIEIQNRYQEKYNYKYKKKCKLWLIMLYGSNHP